MSFRTVVPSGPSKKILIYKNKKKYFFLSRAGLNFSFVYFAAVEYAVCGEKNRHSIRSHSTSNQAQQSEPNSISKKKIKTWSILTLETKIAYKPVRKDILKNKKK